MANQMTIWMQEVEEMKMDLNKTCHCGCPIGPDDEMCEGCIDEYIGEFEYTDREFEEDWACLDRLAGERTDFCEDCGKEIPEGFGRCFDCREKRTLEELMMDDLDYVMDRQENIWLDEEESSYNKTSEEAKRFERETSSYQAFWQRYAFTKTHAELLNEEEALLQQFVEMDKDPLYKSVRV